MTFSATAWEILLLFKSQKSIPTRLEASATILFCVDATFADSNFVKRAFKCVTIGMNWAGTLLVSTFSALISWGGTGSVGGDGGRFGEAGVGPPDTHDLLECCLVSILGKPGDGMTGLYTWGLPAAAGGLLIVGTNGCCGGLATAAVCCVDTGARGSGVG